MGFLYSLSKYGSRVVFTAFFKVRVFGRENVPRQGPVLLAGNHQSYLDPVLCGMGLARELDYMARDSLFRNKIFGAYISSLNAFPIQRDQADIKAIKQIISRLQDKRAVVLFPEATRTADGRIGKIKSGIELIARRGKATTLPVVIDGAFEAWPRHQKLPAPGTIFVQYGEPITPEQTRQMGRDEYVKRLNRQMRQMQHDLRKRIGKKPYQYDLDI